MIKSLKNNHFSLPNYVVQKNITSAKFLTTLGLTTVLSLSGVTIFPLVNIANAHDGNGRFGLDITRYCVEKFGSGWRGDLDQNLGAAGWSCFKEGSNGGRIGIDMAEACTMQYGSEYFAHNTDNSAAGWHCHKK